MPNDPSKQVVDWSKVTRSNCSLDECTDYALTMDRPTIINISVTYSPRSRRNPSIKRIICEIE